MALASFAGCGGQKPPTMQQSAECMGATITPFKGDRQLVVSSLQIAESNQGFDLNGDGKVDNKLAALGAVANQALMDSFTKGHDIVIPVEMFGYNGESNTTCTKLAFYVGKFNVDRDGDKNDTTWNKGDCLDTDPAVHNGATENLTNRLDDDCDGFADNMTAGTAPSDTKDLDGDGYTLAMGDCDDRADTPEHKALAMTRHPGAKDICNDGIDQNCDGIPDNDPSCDPFAENAATFNLLSQSFDAMMSPQIEFKTGAVKNGTMAAGPGKFFAAVSLKGQMLSLTLTSVRLSSVLTDDATTKHTHAMNGLMGGVIDVQTLAQVKGINAAGFLKPTQSLLDAVFAGPVGSILGLAQDMDGHYMPDIDVDGDGLESFWGAMLAADGTMVVDTCKDGDGTIVHNNFDGMGTSCVFAKDAKGVPRFVDGLSMALKYNAVPAVIGTVIQ
jgi:hypothetical protein